MTDSRSVPTETTEPVFDREALEESLEQIITNAEAIPGDSWNEPHPNLIQSIRNETILIRTLFNVAEETTRKALAASRSPTADPEKDFGKLLDDYVWKVRLVIMIGEELTHDEIIARHDAKVVARQSLVDAYYEKHTCVGTECGWYKTTVELRAALAALREENERLKTDIEIFQGGNRLRDETMTKIARIVYGIEEGDSFGYEIAPLPDAVSALRAELASLRDSVLTPDEAQQLLHCEKIADPFPPNAYAKLRRISSANRND